LSTNEIYAGETRAGKNSGKRLGLILLAILAAASVLGAAAYFVATHRRAQANKQSAPAAAPLNEGQPAEAAATAAAKSWKIAGALTEACTCSVPCSCNFGEGPSPHSYCYPFYSYQISKGNYGDIQLDGLRFGSADLRGGRTLFIDERADERQREALRLIMARVISRVPQEEAEAKAKEIAGEVRYTSVEQTFDERKNSLKVAGFGEFAADYIMGLDKSAPVVVRNNTTWRIRDAIKAKTSIYKVKVGRDVVDTKATNSNQGEFEYSSEMNFGGPVQWNCGACANRAAHAGGAGSHSCSTEMKK
jgi:hypothetical protein